MRNPLVNMKSAAINFPSHIPYTRAAQISLSIETANSVSVFAPHPKPYTTIICTVRRKFVLHDLVPSQTELCFFAAVLRMLTQ